MSRLTWHDVLSGLGASDGLNVVVTREYELYNIEINGERIIKDATHTELMALTTVLTKLIGKKDMKALIRLSRKLPDVGTNGDIRV